MLALIPNAPGFWARALSAPAACVLRAACFCSLFAVQNCKKQKE
jgi:hypothetical protein